MTTGFYQRHSGTLLIIGLIALPFLFMLGEQIPVNNDIEAWLPRNSQIREDYNQFCRTFGADETILIAFPRPFPDSAQIEATARRLAGLDGVASCWSRKQVLDTMAANEVEPHIARERLVNLLTARRNELETMLVTINQHGIADRAGTLKEIRSQLSYCGMSSAIVAGGSVVANQLDLLGSPKEATALFCLTLIICMALLQFSIGCWKTSAALMLANLLSIHLTTATLWAIGGEMNFIMSSLPVMVMVFTTAASIHFIGHFSSLFSRRQDHVAAAVAAIRAVIRPSLFAAVTTIIGLVSLVVSDVGPIPAFGMAGAIGTAWSFLVGILLTPAVLIVLQYRPSPPGISQLQLERTAMGIVNRPGPVLAAGMAMTALCFVGMFSLTSLISPLDFLPSNDPVLRDTVLINEKLTSPTSIEAVIDFGSQPSSFIERLRYVRQIEGQFGKIDNICHTLSLADFFPDELSERHLSLSRLASASAAQGVNGMLADGSRLWRVSMRLRDDSPAAIHRTIDLLKQQTQGEPVVFTGIGPLLEYAQTQIFDGFWRSFTSAFLLITVVMMIALRSLGAGLIAMIPNLTPIVIVFGILGWCRYPIDIGIMMTASIALGLAVDGTFHFLFSYRDEQLASGCRYRAVRRALLQTGMPIISSAVICGCGLLALGLSPFKPTMRFGLLMFALLNTALLGDLLLLPAFLAFGATRKQRRLRSVPAADESSRIAA
ncbi:MAG: MMPL family transporter [Planctomycetaceae bacterium]